MNTTNNPSYEGQFTKEQFSALQSLYDHFNKRLFGGGLGGSLLNLSRKSKAMGFYSPGRWVGKETTAETKIDEISLNPDFLHVSVKEYCQTLVHEMVHLWQHHFGKPTPGYHNKEFAAKMKEVGLQPTHNGLPYGKEVGKKMSDLPIEGGVFEEAFKTVPEEFLLPFIASPDEERKKKSKKKNKVKYTCPQCNANAWGKAGMIIMCGECSEDEQHVQFEEEANEANMQETELAEFVDLIENA
jgi:predicted SprT family Zn-dependent metalloprotease